MNKKSICIMFESMDEGGYYAKYDNFRWVSYQVFENGSETGYCLLISSDGMVNDGTQEGCMEEIYEVDLYPADIEVLYHDNENGETYTKEEFVKKFVNNDDYQIFNIYGVTSRV